jgi:hypothetical protein
MFRGFEFIAVADIPGGRFAPSKSSRMKRRSRISASDVAAPPLLLEAHSRA